MECVNMTYQAHTAACIETVEHKLIHKCWGLSIVQSTFLHAQPICLSLKWPDVLAMPLMWV